MDMMITCFDFGLTVNIACANQGDQLFVHPEAAVQTHVM